MSIVSYKFRRWLTASFVMLCLSMTFGVGSVIAQAPEDDERQAPRMSQAEYSQKIRLAEVYEETRDIQNAARIYEQLFHTNPTDETVFEGLTRTLVQLKRYDEAEKIIDFRMQHDESLNILLLYAQLEARMNKRSEALEGFRKAQQATNATDCGQLLPIVYAMMDVSYNQEALELLDKMRKLAGGDGDVCSSQIAGLYLRLGEFDRASKEFLDLLKSGEGNVGMVEQRLAQYMTDSLSRTTVLNALEKEILAVPPVHANLRLLAWLYGEKKDYAKALTTIVKLDDVAGQNDRTAQGFELLQFADRVRMEGALDVAVEAYRQAIARLKMSASPQQHYFVAQAELGALKTAESYYLSRTLPKDSLLQIATQFESYAAAQPGGQAMYDLPLEALTHAGNLAFHQLFDLDRATKDYEGVVAHSMGMTDNARTAAFGLVDIAVAREDLPLAERRLTQIEQMLTEHHLVNDKEIRNHILYDRALNDYYQLNFDSALSKLQTVADNPESDFANDAIALSAIIQENNNIAGRGSLSIFARSALMENAHKYAAADSGYAAIASLLAASPLSDDATIRHAEMLVKLGRPLEATEQLEKMQEIMLTSLLLDEAAFREAEIVEHDLHDKAKAQKLYEDFLAHYPNSNFTSDARERARKLRGDSF